MGWNVNKHIDWPQLKLQPSAPRGRRGFFILLAIVAVIVLGSRTAISYWVDLLWFRSLGYGDVFLRTFSLQWGIFAVFAAATFVVLLGAYSLLHGSHQDDLPSDHTILIGGQPINLPVKPVLRVLGIVVALLIALATGGAMAADWPTLALFWFAPQTTSGVSDPIFGLPLNFFLFTLPAWNLIAGWLLTLAIVTCIMAALFLLISGGAQALREKSANIVNLPWRGLCTTVAFLLFVLSLRTWLGRFAQLYEHHTIFDGVTYTDAHVTLTGMLLLSGALALGGLIAAASAAFSPRGRWLIAAVVPAVVIYAGVGAVGWYVTSFLVKPNELVREQPSSATTSR